MTDPADPDGMLIGHEALNEQGQKLIDRMPEFVFNAAGPVYVSGDMGLLAFNLGVPEHRRRSAGSTWR
jgi:hypothetical protein